jgi:hypothetical protein
MVHNGASGSRARSGLASEEGTQVLASSTEELKCKLLYANMSEFLGILELGEGSGDEGEQKRRRQLR